MKTNLIDRLKNEKYKKCYLKTTNIIAQNQGFIKNQLKLLLTISDDQETIENWSIQVNKVKEYHNLISISYLPFFKITIEKNHPLLWNYNYVLIVCELNGLQTLNTNIQNELISDLASYYSNELGSFIKFETNPISKPIQNSEGKRLFRTNKKLFEVIKPILEKHQISVSNLKIEPNKQKETLSNAKVMLFSNPYVSSSDALKGHSYIIADEFELSITK